MDMRLFRPDRAFAEALDDRLKEIYLLLLDYNLNTTIAFRQRTKIEFHTQLEVFIKTSAKKFTLSMGQRHFKT